MITSQKVYKNKTSFSRRLILHAYFNSSGLSMKEYCQKYGYTYYIFGYYKRKFEKANNFPGFIEVKEESINQEPKPESLDNGLIEIKIKEITIKLDNKKIISLFKEILS